MSFSLFTFLLALSTFLPRLLPALFITKIHLPKKARLFLQLLPYTVMAALIFPGILTTDPDHISIGLCGGAAAVLCAWLKLPLIVSILAAAAADFALYLFFGTAV